MKTRLTNKLFIFAFLFLYALVALISFCHAIEFFNIGNVQWMSVTLAFAFELGLAVCLASILIGTNKRNNIAWLLLTLLVIVQVVGNTYSVFKYISESQVDYYNYLAKPLLFWIQEVSEETVQIIVSWIIGAILPIVALLMTEMVANGIKENQMEDDKALEEKSVRELENEEKHETEHITPLVEPIFPDPIEDDIKEPAERIDPVGENHIPESVMDFMSCPVDENESEEKNDPVDDGLVEEEPLVEENKIDPVEENTDDSNDESEIQVPDEVIEERIDPSVIENAFKEDDIPVTDEENQKEQEQDSVVRYAAPFRKKVNIVDKTLERDAEKLNPEIVKNGLIHINKKG